MVLLEVLKIGNDWNKKWYHKMHTPVIQNKYTISKETCLEHPFLIPFKIKVSTKRAPKLLPTCR
jgi:deoxyribodipyrimidine photo-lyase